MIISMEYKDKREYECGSFKRNSSVAPFSLFISFSLFSIFFVFFGGLNGSFYLTLICPLWDLLILSSLRSFPQLMATLYFTRGYRRSFTLYKVLKHKEHVVIMIYAMYASAGVAGTCMT